MSLYREQAVVIRAWKLGEADRIVSLFTRGHGKVRGVAKGVRRTRSKFGSRLESMCHVAVQLYQGRGELETITQVETIDRFVSLRRDPDRFARASAMLEAIDQVTLDREPDAELYRLLTRALATLDRDESPLVVPAFFLKLLAHDGVQPQLDRCVRCNAEGPLVAIELLEGGVLCPDCRQGRPISAEALLLLRQILGGRLAAALAEEPGSATAEVDDLATSALEHHIERRLRSVAVLDQRGP